RFGESMGTDAPFPIPAPKYPGGNFASIPTGKKSSFSELQTGQFPRRSALTDAN
ncbi:hypothetical protein L195_g051724, partial [Trifolium pratense]